MAAVERRLGLREAGRVRGRRRRAAPLGLRQLVAEPRSPPRCPLLRLAEGRREDEPATPSGAREHVLEREHPAPRRAEQVDAVEAERCPQRRRARRGRAGATDRVVLGPARAAAAELVVEDDAAALLGELLERLEVVVRRAGPAVQAEQRQPSAARPRRRPGTRSRSRGTRRRPRPRSQQRVERDEGEEDDADHAVHREEGGVESAQVARADERVLVAEQRRDRGDAEPVRRPRRRRPSPASASSATTPTCSARAPANTPRSPKRVGPRVQPLGAGRRSRSKSE